MSTILNIPARVILGRVFADLALQMQQRVGAVAAGTDVEVLHDYRIALRKTRSLLKLFAPQLGPEPEAIACEFGWLADLTGPVRDLDVLLHTASTQLPGLILSEACDLTPLLGILRRDREHASRELQQAVGGLRYQQAIHDWLSYLTDRLPDAEITPALGAPLPPLLHAIVLAQCVKLLKAGRALNQRPTATQLHRMRIRIKRLRYLLVTLLPFVKGGDYKFLLKPLSQLQICLGVHQDAVIAIEHLQKIDAHTLQSAACDQALDRWLDLLEAQQTLAREQVGENFAAFAAACDKL